MLTECPGTSPRPQAGVISFAATLKLNWRGCQASANLSNYTPGQYKTAPTVTDSAGCSTEVFLSCDFPCSGHVFG